MIPRPPSTRPTPLSFTSQKHTGNRILLVETSSTQAPRIERYTLQEVPVTSPTYYRSASLSHSNSTASTLSTTSTLSTQSQPSRCYTPPASPTTCGKQTEPIPSWTSRMDRQLRTTPFPPLAVDQLSTPLGWLRPSLTLNAVLDLDTHPSYFVFLGFGPADVWMELFDLKTPMPVDRNGNSERSFLFQVEQDQPAVMCTLATLPLSRRRRQEEECTYLENLILNRVGVTSILVALPIKSTLQDILDTLDKINTNVKGLDPQETWYQHLTLIFYPDDYTTSSDRIQLVRMTLPSLTLSPMPCILILGDRQQQYHRRVLYQQACLHQTDQGWWHGSTVLNDKDNDEEDDEDDDDDDGLGGVLLPVATVIGKKAPVKKKKPLFTIDPLPFLANPPPSTDTGVGLNHRFSKKWKDAPRRHQSQYDQ
ncbi:hypothetical protein BC941DRAFT_440070 [Chlamydoabsidia padenii]|nr:hypothetical protein BC941DRAFT_440070 [Chlamydoabsidia padenii]